MPVLSPRRRKYAVLWALYFVEGLPYGFQTTALPAYLREAGVSLTQIGFAAALSLPWMLKVLWAPLVDRYSSTSYGRRRSWIVPLQALLAVACAAAALAQPSHRLGLLLVLVLLMNLFASTLDIAVDGLAVDLLASDELGKGNIAQVVGYKLGILVGGGVLVWASGTIGWSGLFLAMAALVLLSMPLTLAMSERRLLAETGRESLLAPTFGVLMRDLKRALTSRGAGWLFLFVCTYKLGESMADHMFRPFLVDAGYSPQQIGVWVGTWGVAASIAGSTFGGLLASRIPLLSALSITAFLRVAPIAGEWWLSLTSVTPARAITVTCAENFFGGALTTALFAFMMSRVNRRIGATHYTLLAAAEVWGKVPSATLSGVVADATSYSFVFGMATLISGAFLLLLLPLRKIDRGEETKPTPTP